MSARQWIGIHYLIQFVCRYYIATVILMYAVGKLLQTQFYTTPSELDTPVKDLSGMSLTWAFFGYSYGYTLVLAAAQILSSLFLFFRRTVRLGVLLFLPIIGNIVLIDYFYDIVALPAAISMLVAALYLFLADGRAFLAYSIGEPYVSLEKTPQNKAWEPWERRIRWGKCVLIPLTFVGVFCLLHTLRKQSQPTTPLAGIWAFPSDERRWDRLYIDTAQEAYIRPRGGGASTSLLYSRCEIDTTARTISIWPASRHRHISASAASPSPSEFRIEGTYELSTDGNTLTVHSPARNALILENVPTGHPIGYFIP